MVDTLRFVDRALRTEKLRVELARYTPETLGYDPTGSVLDPRYRITKILTEDCRVFRTKARAPSLVICEVSLEAPPSEAPPLGSQQLRRHRIRRTRRSRYEEHIQLVPRMARDKSGVWVNFTLALHGAHDLSMARNALALQHWNLRIRMVKRTSWISKQQTAMQAALIAALTAPCSPKGVTCTLGLVWVPQPALAVEATLPLCLGVTCRCQHNH